MSLRSFTEIRVTLLRVILNNVKNLVFKGNALLKIGLVGCGYLGSRHLKHLLDIEGVEVSGVWDMDPATRKKANDEFDVQVAVDLEDLISRSDVVDIVTPTSTHYEIGLQVIEAGLPLFVEKPICATYDEGLQMIEKARSAGVPIQVGHIERFNRAFRALGSVKVRPGFIEAHRLAPWSPRGGDVAVVHDLMIHDLDLILTLADDFPVQIHANGVGVVTDSVDIANVRLEFASGLVANVTASRISLKRMRKLRLFGDSEYIALDLADGTCEYVGVTSDKSQIPVGSQLIGALGEGEMQRLLYRRFLPAEEGDALKLQLAAFRDAVIQDSAPQVTGEDGLNALKLAESIVAQIKER